MTKRATTLYLIGLFLGTLAIRSAIAFNSGVWADEGSFLAVVAIPSWRGMIDFLRLHESHPPFFYAVMRLWMSATGGSDTASLLLPAIIGALIIPAVYIASASLFSSRTGLLTATLATVSPALAEYSAQLRPYGLLPLLVLASTSSMIVALQRRVLRTWAAYVVVTILLLYTHNWGWVVASAQQLAFIIAAARLPSDARRSLAVQWLAAWGVILIAYSPWFTTLLYQGAHTGHSGVTLDGPIEALSFVAFGFLVALQTFFLGSSGGANALLAGLVVATLVASVFVYRLRRQPVPRVANASSQSIRSQRAAALMLVTVIVASWAIAMIMSPLSNLILPRCLAALAPLVLIVFSWWCVNLLESRAMAPNAAALVTALTGFLLGQAMVELAVLIRTPRSNAREVAFSVRRELLPGDLVILAPEWYSASFNHYFGDPVEQVDYPHSGRNTMTDFSDTWKRASDTVALAALLTRIKEASRKGRRIWLVSESEYLKPPDAAEIEAAEKYRKPATLLRARIARMRAALDATFGAPSAVTPRIAQSVRYDDIRALLYTPMNRHVTTSR
jgi:hypothetical protein